MTDTETVQIDQPNGDIYVGDVVTRRGRYMVLRNYTVYYHWQAAPVLPGHPQQTTQVRIDPGTVVGPYRGQTR